MFQESEKCFLEQAFSPWISSSNLSKKLMQLAPCVRERTTTKQDYLSSHNHEGEKWVPEIVVTCAIKPFSASMIMEGRGVRQYQLKAGKYRQVVSFCCGCGCLGKPTQKKTHTIHAYKIYKLLKHQQFSRSKQSPPLHPPQKKTSQRNKNSTTLHPGPGQLLAYLPILNGKHQETLFAQRRPSLADNGLKDTMPPTKILGSVASAGSRLVDSDSFVVTLFNGCKMWGCFIGM